MSKVALFTPNNRLPYSEALSSWSLDGVFIEENTANVLAPDGSQTAMRVACDASSGYHTAAWFALNSGNTMTGERVVSEFFWHPGSCQRFIADARDGLTVDWHIYAQQNADAATPVMINGYLQKWEPSSLGWYRCLLVSSRTIDYTNSGHISNFFFLVSTGGLSAYQGTSGYDYYLWHPSLTTRQPQPYMPTSSTSLIGNSVIFDTEWESTSGSEKFFDEAKTPGGARTRYVYGKRERYRLDTEMLSSRDVEVINRWWRDGTPILMRDADNPFAAITSVFISDTTPPVTKAIKPYIDRWAMSIELEGY